ncbi:MAG TPA: glycosyltransferase family 4 protein [Acetobacteraceae bacterium]|nr:glycosyltransferase family 4 protein [Acetobacteraceae bacterium]
MNSAMRLALITAAPYESVTGASFYHRRILAAWNDMGGASEVIALDGKARPSLVDRLEGRSVLVEGAVFELAADAIPALQARGAAALIHHPTALEPGTPEARRQALKTLECELLPGFRRVIAASAPISDRLVGEFGVSPDAVRVVVPGTDKAPRRTIEASRPDGSPCGILSLGTLTYRKGHDVLLRALAGLFDLDWHLTLAGESRDPDYVDSLSALIRGYGIAGRVTLLGPLTGEALEEAWSKAEIFALATRFEGYGMVIAEALARGLPVAITDGGAAATLVPAEAGVVAPVDDVEQLGKALRRLVFSPQLRAMMGEAAWRQGQSLPGWPDQARALQEALA